MQRDVNPASAGSPSNKLPGLEVLRFLAALAILVVHYRHFTFGDDAADLAQDRLPFHGLFGPLYQSGSYAVRMFWCISGFIFFWKYRDAIASGLLDGWKFFVLRFSRLYPLHLVTLLIVAALQPLYLRLTGSYFVYQNNDALHFVLQLFMAGNETTQDTLSFNGPIWSVSVEVVVYFFFFAMLLVSRSWLLNLVVIACSLTIHGQLSDCFVFFYTGGLAAMARQFVMSRGLPSLAFEGAGWLAVGLFLVYAYRSADGHLESIGLLVLLICTPVLLYSLSRDAVLPPRLQRIVEAAGNMTYASYLLHFPIQLAIMLGLYLIQLPLPVDQTAFFGLFVGITLLASYLTYRYFEEPAQALIRDILLRPRAAPAIVTPP